MLIIDDTKPIFNTEEIHRGTLIYARNINWSFGISGFVTETSEKELRIQFLPSIQNVVSHCYVTAEGVAEGLWELRYSSDGLETVQTYPNGDSDDTEATEGDPEEGEPEDDGGAG